MRILTAWDADSSTAAIQWRYPVDADAFPSGAINTALAHFYNQTDDMGEAVTNYPYLFIARDEDDHQTGLVVLDPGSTELTPWDIASYWRQVLDERSHSHDEAVVSLAGDQVAIRWAFPSGFQFPADAVNAILFALYSTGTRPFLYPVFDRADDESRLQQVGLLISESRDMAGTPSQNWRDLRRDFNRIMNDPSPEVPWDQTEWSLL